jgi:hypothetical protein
MSGDLGQYDRVRFVTDRLRGDGAPLGSVGYIIEAYPDGAFEVEVSDPSTGTTRALVVAKPDELERADLPPAGEAAP